jgi:dihydrofolate reductase
MPVGTATIARMTRPTLSLIAIVARNGSIGKNNELLFRLPEDMQHFKRSTLGCPVIMGRKTWESLPARARPLPGRINIVVTRNPLWHADGALAVASLQEALSRLGQAPKAFVIGGAQLYAAALPLLDEMLLTEVDQDVDGDVHFPAWNRSDFVETKRETHHAGEPNHFDYAFVTYQRKR